MTGLVRIPSFQANQQVTTENGRFTPAALRSLNDALKTLGAAINEIAALPEIQAALVDLDTATAAAQTAADNANAAAATTTSATSLANSYVDDLTLTGVDAGTDASIIVSAHTRKYGDGTSVSVTGATITGLDFETSYYIYYDQPSRAGGVVSYLTTIDPAVAAQVGDRHVVGAALTPADGEADSIGNPVNPPGSGAIKNLPVV
jgi:hypothetical protein